jgi:cytoskeletal protein CcmA (bactofilin family)
LTVEELDNVYIDNANANDVLAFDGSDWYNANVDDLLTTASVSFQDVSSETFTGDIVPSLNNTYTIGTNTHRWADIFLGPGTLNITDNVTGANAGLTVADGVLQVNGANQLQVGQLKFVDNNIESTSASVNIEIGLLSSSADIIFNRDVVLGTGKSLTFPDSTEQTTAFIGTANSLATARTIALSGDVSGSVSFDGSASVNISTSIQPNSVALGTDTTGNYMSNLTQGTGVSITHTPGEGSNATIAIGQAVGTSSSVQFASVTAPLTGNASTATALETARNISLTGDVSGSVSFNGTSDVSISATVQPLSLIHI